MDLMLNFVDVVKAFENLYYGRFYAANDFPEMVLLDLKFFVDNQGN